MPDHDPKAYPFANDPLTVRHYDHLGLSEIYIGGRFVAEVAHTTSAPHIAAEDRWFAEEIARRWNAFKEEDK